MAATPGDRRLCLEPTEADATEGTVESPGFDKVFWVGVRATPSGYELICREHDLHLRRWGSVNRRDVPQRAFLEHACFDLLLDVFNPLAQFTPAPDDDTQVQLSFKGSDLPRQSDRELFVHADEIYQPLLRRSDRSGALIENGVVPVPWTYLTTLSREESNWRAAVHSGVRRPFGVQRGRVEQLAVAVHRPPGPTRLRFHSRTNPDQSLVGYEVFREAADGKLTRIGFTDRDGVITIPPGDAPISMILLRSEGRLLAKVPAPAGGGPLLQTPIADNVARLRAQSEAQVIREQLVDVVARRAIMMNRVRSLLKKKKVDEARTLMMELDSLPTSTSFARSLAALEKRLPKSNDPAVTRTIEKLFSSTREMLGKFLDRRSIIDLQTQVNEARSGGG